jgi:hypothetical protein
MSLIHPLWPDTPTESELDRGSAFVESARELEPKTEREQAYVDAVGEYFRDAHQRDAAKRQESFARGWEHAHERFPEDWEATALFVLNARSLGYPRASRGALMDELRVRVPDHPAAHHYAIHMYDTPSLASRALETARSYARLTPDVPHALHMPSHIFTRLGLWSESIEMNERSAAAARDQGQRSGQLDFHYAHAAAYLVYAYLQVGQDDRAHEVVTHGRSLEGPFSDLNLITFAGHLTAMPVRYVLERHAWEEALSSGPRGPTRFPSIDSHSTKPSITSLTRSVMLEVETRRRHARRSTV